MKFSRFLLPLFALVGMLFFAWDAQKDIQNISFVSKEKALSVAQEFLSLTGQDVTAYRHALSFTGDDIGNSLLVKELGEEQAEEFAQKQNAALFQYQVRFVKELSPEEFTVWIDAETGDRIGFDHRLAESEARASLTKEQAQESALVFLETQGWNRDSLEAIDYSSERFEQREDHYFAFKIEETEVQTEYGASYARIGTFVRGDQVESVEPISFFVPEEFERTIGGEFGSGMLLVLLSAAATMLMFIAAVVVMIQAFTHKSIHWKPFLFIGGLVAVVAFLDGMNSYPTFFGGYTTETSFFVYSATWIVILFIGAVFTAGGLFVTGATGESVTRKLWPERLGVVGEIFTGKWTKKAYRREVGRGYTLACIFIGITTGIYFIGEQYLGVWTLVSAQEFNMVLSVVPAFSLFALLLMAAASEEFTYRLFGISFFRKYTKSSMLAVAITTIIWAVAHSAYPVFPFYFRAIELCITGGLFGYFFIRYGFLSVFTAHYVYNGIISLPLFILFPDHRVSLLVSVSIVLLLPLIPTLFRDSQQKSQN